MDDYPRSRRLARPKPRNEDLRLHRLMRRHGFYRGEIDGEFGRKTDQAVLAVLSNVGGGPAPEVWRAMSQAEQRTLAVQLLLKRDGHDPGPQDGMWRDKTSKALAKAERE